MFTFRFRLFCKTKVSKVMANMISGLMTIGKNLAFAGTPIVKRGASLALTELRPPTPIELIQVGKVFLWCIT